MSRITLSLIVAMTSKRIIGNKGQLPWGHLPSDLAHFKKVTMEAGIVIMGRATYQSILSRNGTPLLGRQHIVLSRVRTSSAHESVQFVGSLEEACEEVAAYGGRACVIGGGEVYKLFLPVPDLIKAYVTTVNAPSLAGDAYFPEMESGPNTEWKCTERTRMCKVDPRDAHESSLSVWERFGIV